ncbi:MAG: C-GCAxxG-C-C family protein [Thermoplasmatota archaeon]
MAHRVDRGALVALAERNFRELLNCAESTAGAVSEHFGVGGGAFPRAATAFGGGVARTGGTCGAVSGALMGFGLLYGRERGGNHRHLDRVYAMVRDFTSEFRRRFGSTICRELLGCDIGTTEGRIRAKKGRLFDRQCPQYVTGAMEILADIVEREAAGGYGPG